jgi:hypothetical protein
MGVERIDRKAAISAYKERKPVAGVYVVRCAATGEQWVGTSPDLATVWVRRSFSLRQAADPNRSLQAAWNAHGENKFTFAVLEELDPEALAFARERTFRERLLHWRDSLGAATM